MSVWLAVLVHTPAHAALGSVLTYRHTAALTAGTLVRVPLGARETLGMVWEATDDEASGEIDPGKVRDISEYIAGLELNTADLKPVNLTVTYQEPCHLVHAQRITAQPRKLLKQIPGLKLVEMAESSLCCGSAGIYNVTQPAMAAQLGNRKIDNAERTKADVVVTANPGCHLQLAGGLNQRGSQMKVLHIAEVLDMAYGGAV